MAQGAGHSQAELLLFLPALLPYLPDPRGWRGILCVAGRISGTWKRKGLYWPGKH